MKLPNGYGSVYKLGGKRRNPWAARKTTGWKVNEETQKASPVYKFIGFYPTKTEAMQALADYNADPKDFEAITFEELYEKWSKHAYPRYKKSSVNTYKAAYKVCAPIYEMKISDIKLIHLQRVVDGSGKGKETLRRVKSLIRQMFQFAIAYEFIDSSKLAMIDHVDISNGADPEKVIRIPFSESEIDKLWKSEAIFAKAVLILIYSGMRISELCELKIEDVHLLDGYIYIRSSKTDAGIRIVPIAKKITSLISYFLVRSKSGYLLENGRKTKFNYKVLRDHYWNPLMAEIHANHLPHDTRHTTVTLLTNAGVDERLIKQIVGHKGNGVTEDTYTHFNLQAKLNAINSI